MARFASLLTRHWRRTLIVGFLVVFACAIYGASVSEHLSPDTAEDPQSESARADRQIEDLSGITPDAQILALVQLRGGLQSPTSQGRIRIVVRSLRAEQEVASVRTPQEDPGLVSRDQALGLIVASLRASSDRTQRDAAARAQDELAPYPFVKVGGRPAANEEVDNTVEKELTQAELIALPILAFLCFFFFRGVVAAALPLVIALVAILVTSALLRLIGTAIPVSVFALNVVSGLGVGLALDYSLLMLSRFREELQNEAVVALALRRTMRSAGRTVIFSALTIISALGSLLVFPHRFIYSMGIGGAMVTAVAALCALTLLPAMLAALGPRVNAFAPTALRRASEHEAETGDLRWYRLAKQVMRRPIPVALITAVALAIPASQLLNASFTTTEVDARALPPGSDPRIVDDAVATRFGSQVPRLNVRVVVESPRHHVAAAVRARISRLPGVAGTTTPVRLSSQSMDFEVLPHAPALSQGAERLVADIRDLSGDPILLVGGPTASFIDSKASLRSRAPLALAIVALSSLILMFLLTGSVVLPIKAVLFNLFSLSATLGLLAYVFAGDRLESLLSYQGEGALDLTLPPVLLATVFGLSTDYGVFVLSRIKEARDHGAQGNEAVAVGLARAGRIVTAAAALFAVATGAFAVSQILPVKEIGIALALTVVIDATVIRALLLPSTMAILGDLNWWCPAPLARFRDWVGLKDDGDWAANKWSEGTDVGRDGQAAVGRRPTTGPPSRSSRSR